MTLLNCSMSLYPSTFCTLLNLSHR